MTDLNTDGIKQFYDSMWSPNMALVSVSALNVVRFFARLSKSTESYCCHFDVGMGVGITL